MPTPTPFLSICSRASRIESGTHSSRSSSGSSLRTTSKLVDENLRNALALATNAQAAYTAAPDSVRRQLNQALFTKIRITNDGEVTSDLAQPFDVLLSPVARRLTASPAPREAARGPEPRREGCEIEEEAHDDVGLARTVRPFQGRGGLNYDTLVDLTGLEPGRREASKRSNGFAQRGAALR